MRIKEIMSSCITECTEDTPLAEVYELLRKCEHGIAVVVDSARHRVPIGVVSERSILDELILRGRQVRGTTAGSVMDSRILTVKATESISRLNGNETATVVVTNERREVCGLVPRSYISNSLTASAPTHPTNLVVVSSTDKGSPAQSEIPAFGWVH